MAKEIDLKRIVTNLSKLGVTATVTKSRIELLKVLTPPTQTPQTQNWLNTKNARWFQRIDGRL